MLEIKEVAIIIVNYNTKSITLNCINSLLDNCYGFNYSILIWDNNSADNSFQYFKEYFEKYKNIQIIESKTNLGFGKACNHAAALLKNHEYFLFLNPDTVLESNIVLAFINSYKSLSKIYKIGCIGAELFDINLNSNEYKKRFPTVLKFILGKYAAFDKESNVKILNQDNINYQIVDYICGADLFIQSSLFFKMGGFDEDYFMYYEEIDLQYKITKNGYNNILIKNEGIKHIGGASLSENGKLINLYALESIIKYFKKHSSIIEFLVLKMFLVFKIPFLFLKYVILMPKSLNRKYFKNVLRVIINEKYIISERQ